ncbi:MAG TPA: SMC family ATPase [Thermodesulfobacteriota bacterium]
MIPRRLALRNFLSYGDRVEPLDFSAIHVACLTGDNGHGKSALLDAITWSLFGKARAGADDLVRRGQTEMWVEFEFELDGAVYRVIRKRDISRKTGVSDLQFQVRDPATGAFRSLTGTGIRETEERIAEVLRLDYETFVNASFLLQGRADAFTQKTPAERKRILAEILSLGVFDDLEARARAKQREAEEVVAAANRAMAALEAALADRPAAEAERERLAAALSAAEAALAADEASLAAARAAHAALVQAEADAARLGERIEETRRRADEAQARAAREAARVAAYEQVIAEAPTIEAGLARLRDLRAAEQAMAERLQRERALDARRTRLEAAIAEARSRIEVRRATVAEAHAGLAGRLAEAEGLLAARDEIEAGLAALRAAEDEERAFAARLEESLRLTSLAADLERRVAEAEMARRLERERLAARLADLTRRAEGADEQRARLAAIDQKLAALDVAARRREEVFEAGTAARTRFEAIPDEVARLTGEIQTIEARLADLRQAAGDCPLCDQPLPDDRREAVVERMIREELEPRRAKLAEFERIAPALDREVRRLREEYVRLGRELAAREALQQERSRVAAAVADAEAAAGELAELAERVRAADAALADGAIAPEVRAALAEARTALAGLGYDRAAHDRVRERVAGLRPFETRAARLEQAARDAAGLREELSATAAELADLDRTLAEETYAETQRAELARVAAEIAEVAYDAAEHAACRKALAEHEAFERRAAELAQAVREVEGARAALAEARASASAARELAARLAEERAARLAEAARLPEVAREIAALEARVADRRREVGDLRERVGRADARLAELDRKQQELDTARAQVQALGETRRTYADLARILGRNGVQALIIENALPEIEDEANRLLGRLTDYAMRIKLETQRDKKTGGVAETLEIRISDEQGTRPYETFSGGEAFRVNFALRIALSRLLARRAGASLQTLVVDEGFGTQDGSGKQKVVEAIQAVQGDFAKILVITHLEDLKDRFPARIEVTKHPEYGSVYRVV